MCYEFCYFLIIAASGSSQQTVNQGPNADSTDYFKTLQEMARRIKELEKLVDKKTTKTEKLFEENESLCAQYDVAVNERRDMAKRVETSKAAYKDAINMCTRIVKEAAGVMSSAF